MLAICVDPGIIESAGMSRYLISTSDAALSEEHRRWTCRHCGTRLLRATFRYYSIEQVEILVKVENWSALENGRRCYGGETKTDRYKRPTP